MPGCSVDNCTVKHNGKCKLIKVPTNEARKIKWNAYLVENGRNCPPAKNYWICERHFAFHEDMNGNLSRADNPSIPKSIWSSLVNNKTVF